MIIATRKIRLLLLSTGLLQLTACSLFNIGDNHFICDDPANVTGVTCKTPTAVYKSTNGPMELTEHDVPAGMTLSQYKAQKAATLNEQTRQVDSMVTGTAVVGGAYPLPVRSAAQVMRIWIAPWVDKADDLHVPGYLYTEVTPRKWNVGESEFTGNGVVIPHRIAEVAADQPANSAIGGAQATRGSAYDASPLTGANMGNANLSSGAMSDMASGIASPVQGNPAQSAQSLTVPTSPTSAEVPRVNLGY